MKRAERKEMFARQRAERTAESMQHHEEEMERIERQKQADYADGDVNRLCILSEIEPDRLATTIAQEVASAVVFARLLGVAIDPDQTVFDFLEKVFVEWRKQDAPLFNPISGKFSPVFYCDKKRNFRKEWAFLDPATDYARPVSDFFPPKKAPARRDITVDIPGTSETEQVREIAERINENSLPVFFSATPGDGSDRD
jgi:hypothetical protein